MKQSSRKHTNNDLSPLAFEAPLEQPVPLVPSLADQKQPKKPTRKETRTEQRQLEALRKTAALRAYLPKEERSRPRLVIASSGAPQIIQPLAEPDPGIADHGGMFSYIQRLQEKHARFTLKGLAGADVITYQAEADLRDKYDRAVGESLAGIETGDLSPLCRHLALWGFDLLEDSSIREALQQWWLEAKQGKKDSAQHLKSVLAALSVGRGNLGNATEESKQEKANKRKRHFDARVRTAQVSICQDIQRAINTTLNSRRGKTGHRAAADQARAAIIARFEKSPDAAERSAVKKIKLSNA